MWNVKTNMIPVIAGANGTTSMSFRKYVSNIPGKHDVKNSRKQPYWALLTYFGKYLFKSTNDSTLKLTI